MVTKVVTGYIPIPNHPRGPGFYGDHGAKIFGPLAANGVDIVRYMEQYQDTWLWKYVSRSKVPPTHSAGDNGAKNTLAYHCVQHQKFGWLLKAAIQDPKADTFVWMDYGVGHVPGVTVDVVWDFLQSIQPGDFAIPGCWEKENAVNTDFFPCWRFCGGVMVVPRQVLHKLYKVVKGTALDHVNRTGNVTWEVNTLAEAEHNKKFPKVRWYKADHDQTLFTNYIPELREVTK